MRKFAFEGDEDTYITFLEGILEQALQLALGRTSERSVEPYVLVARQYGSNPGSLLPWQVVVVDEAIGTYYALMTQHATLRLAVAKGLNMLTELRTDGPAKVAYERIKQRRSTPPAKGI